MFNKNNDFIIYNASVFFSVVCLRNCFPHQLKYSSLNELNIPKSISAIHLTMYLFWHKSTWKWKFKSDLHKLYICIYERTRLFKKCFEFGNFVCIQRKQFYKDNMDQIILWDRRILAHFTRFAWTESTSHRIGKDTHMLQCSSSQT